MNESPETAGQFTSQEQQAVEELQPGKTIVFNSPEQQKSTDIKIVKVHKVLGCGAISSWVADVEVEVVGVPGRKSTHPLRMAIKKFREDDPGAVIDSATELRNSYANHRVLQKIGIPTWNTYRINEGEKMALMTLGTYEGNVVVTGNDSYNPFESNPVAQIHNGVELSLEIVRSLNALEHGGYRLKADAWGISFVPLKDQPGTYDVHLLVADLDTLENVNDPEYKEKYPKGIDSRQQLLRALWDIYPGTEDEKQSFVQDVMPAM